MSSMTGTQGYGKPFKEKVPKGYSAGTIQQYTPEQMQILEGMYPHAMPGSYLQRLAGGDQSMFAEMEAPAMKQFGEMQGQLASRFSGMGMGGRKGSGFANTMTQATSDFAQQLQSQRQGLQRQAIQDLMGLSGQLMGQRPYERSLTEKPKSVWESMAIAGAGGLGQGFGEAMGQKIPGLP